VGRFVTRHHRPAHETFLTIEPVPCLWGLNNDLSTRFVSPGFARLVGVSRLLLVGQPCFSLLASADIAVLESLVRTPLSGASAVVGVRHIEGVHIPVTLRRISGGPGRDTAVFTVLPVLCQDHGSAALLDQ
jgi:hypothetical protein